MFSNGSRAATFSVTFRTLGFILRVSTKPSQLQGYPGSQRAAPASGGCNRCSQIEHQVVAWP